jgi:DNA-binding LytR/AlgR family response regulator
VNAHINKKYKALIVDDENAMREVLISRLKQVWPDLEIAAEAANGIAALEILNTQAIDIVFLDIRMPGKNGLETALEINCGTQIVFVTAYDEYAIDAFDRGAIDYLLKPVNSERLQRTCARLQEKLSTKNSPFVDNTQEEQLQTVIKKLLLEQAPKKEYLRWIQASVGNSVRMINTKEILFFRSDEKYTLVKTEESEFLIRKTLKELEEELDPNEFWRVHRSGLVRTSAIERVFRDDRGRQLIYFKDCSETLEVSRNYSHLFHHM